MQIKKYQNTPGPISRATDEYYNGTGWHFVPGNQLKQSDPNYSVVQRKGLDNSYLVDANGILVPERVRNAYEQNKEYQAQLPYQEQNDINDARQMQYRQADREVHNLGMTQLDRTQMKNLGQLSGIVLGGAALAGGGAAAAPYLASYLAPGTMGGNIIGSTAFGTALNEAIKYGTGKTMGEHAVNAARMLGIPQNEWVNYGIQMVGDMPVYMAAKPFAAAASRAMPAVERAVANVRNNIVEGVNSRVQGIRDFNTMVRNQESLQDEIFADVSQELFYENAGKYYGGLGRMTESNGNVHDAVLMGNSTEYIPENSDSWANIVKYKVSNTPILTRLKYPRYIPNQVSMHLPELTPKGQQFATTAIAHLQPGTALGEFQLISPAAQAFSRYSQGQSYLRSLTPFIRNRSIGAIGDINPYSVDSYFQLLLRNAKDPERYALRYFDKPMPGFNDQAKNGIERYAFGQKGGQQTLQPGADQADVINAAIQKINPNARLASVVDGQLRLPYPYLFINKIK